MSRPAIDTAPAAATELPRPRALLLWRALAMVYDALPVLALWMLAGTLFTLAYTFSGHAQRENIAPFSAWQWLLWAVCWAITGWYATASWRRGGQTLGMRPWRLKLHASDGAPLRAASCGCASPWARCPCCWVDWDSGGRGSIANA